MRPVLPPAAWWWGLVTVRLGAAVAVVVAGSVAVGAHGIFGHVGSFQVSRINGVHEEGVSRVERG